MAELAGIVAGHVERAEARLHAHARAESELKAAALAFQEAVKLDAVARMTLDERRRQFELEAAPLIGSVNAASGLLAEREAKAKEARLALLEFEPEVKGARFGFKVVSEQVFAYAEEKVVAWCRAHGDLYLVTKLNRSAFERALRASALSPDAELGVVRSSSNAVQVTAKAREPGAVLEAGA